MTNINETNETTQVVKSLPYTDVGKRWKPPMTLGFIVLLLLSGLALFRANSADNSADGLKKDVASVKTDVATLKTDRDTLKTDMGNLTTTTAGLTTANTKLTDDASKAVTTEHLTKETNKLLEKINKMMAAKADKTELSRLATRTRLKRVEDKLDTYIAVVEAKETPPLANVESEPAVTVGNGTITVIVPPAEE